MLSQPPGMLFFGLKYKYYDEIIETSIYRDINKSMKIIKYERNIKYKSSYFKLLISLKDKAKSGVKLRQSRSYVRNSDETYSTEFLNTISSSSYHTMYEGKRYKKAHNYQ